MVCPTPIVLRTFACNSRVQVCGALSQWIPRMPLGTNPEGETMKVVRMVRFKESLPRCTIVFAHSVCEFLLGKTPGDGCCV